MQKVKYWFYWLVIHLLVHPNKRPSEIEKLKKEYDYQ
jgi:hypothetical protein